MKIGKIMLSNLLALILVFTMTIPAGAVNTASTDFSAAQIEDILSIAEADKRVLSDAKISDEFEDDSIVVVLTTSASKNNRNFTPDDFKDIAAAGVEDIVRLSDNEYGYANKLWTAQKRVNTLAGKFTAATKVSAEMQKAAREFENARLDAEKNTLVSFDEFRRILKIKLAEPGKENVLQAVKILQQRDDVRYAGPNYISKEKMTDVMPNDTRRNDQWSIDKINLPEAWDSSTGSSTIMVGVIDTGIDSAHVDLMNHVNASLSMDFVEDIGGIYYPPTDPGDHGTHVSGIIGAQGNNSVGVVGVNWQVQLVSLRVLDGGGYFGPDGYNGVAQAVNHARMNNIPILNASLAIGENNSSNQTIRDAVAGYNGLYVNSAGNQYAMTNSNPRFGGFSNVLVVGASDVNDTKPDFSNYGTTSTHLFAPGANVLSTIPNDNYAYYDGTSMASPQVAGAAALVKSVNPSLTMSEVRSILLNNVEKIAYFNDKCITGGRLDMFKAVSAAYKNNISAGYSHSLDLRDDGTVWAWGRNQYGQIGDSTTVERTYPVKVSNLTKVIAVSAGDYHNLAVRADGTVWGWGLNSGGQINGSYTNYSSPVQIGGLANIVAVSAGADFSLALNNQGQVFAWGQNLYGQLGLNHTTTTPTPTLVTGLSNVTSISAGGGHSLAVEKSGSTTIVKAWGNNTSRQLGNTSTSARLLTPTQVQSISGITQVSAGSNSSFAIADNGRVYAWGNNTSGALGIGYTGSTISNPTLVYNTIPGAVVKVVARDLFGMALTADGNVYTWGEDYYGSTGNGTFGATNNRPVQASIFGAKDIAMGHYFCMASKANNKVWAWGYNYASTLGVGTGLSSSVTKPTTIFEPMVYGANGFTVELRNDGTVWVTGSNQYGAFGNNSSTTLKSVTPIKANIENVKQIAADGYSVIALKSDGTVWAWGLNTYGVLGDNTATTRTSPVKSQIPAGVSIVDVAIDYHSIALADTGDVYSWGANEKGQLGHTNNSTVRIPRIIPDFSNVIDVDTGISHSIALKADGSVWAWGSNQYGQVGINVSSTTSYYTAPQLCHNLSSGVKAISAGSLHNVVLKNDGTVWSWGYGDSGRLGHGNTTTYRAARQISKATLSNVYAISAGDTHSMAISYSNSIGVANSLWTWGNNNCGHLGIGNWNYTNQITPYLVDYNLFPDAVSAGHSASYVVNPDGSVYSCGWNELYQLGRNAGSTTSTDFLNTSFNLW